MANGYCFFLPVLSHFHCLLYVPLSRAINLIPAVPQLTHHSFCVAGQFTRSGTGGMDRGALRRSVSASRGPRRGQAPAQGMAVRMSRPVQTSLTKDPAMDTPDAERPGHVNFQVGTFFKH